MTRAIRRRRGFPDLATFLEESGMTQRDFARAAGISEPYVSGILAKKQRPSFVVAARLARLAHCPIEAFLFDPPDLTNS